MPQAKTDSTLESLYKILQQEAVGGFQDKTVFGGLDRFLLRWACELEPVVGTFTSYSAMMPPERKAWAETTLPRISGGLEAGPPDQISARRCPPRSAGTTRPAVSRPSLDTEVADLKGIARQILARLRRLGVSTARDLVHLYPNRHNNFANIRKIADLQYGEEQTIVATVWEATVTSQGPKRRSTQAVLGDDTGNVRAIWFNQPYLAKTFRSGTTLVISGKVNVFRGQFVFEAPEYELLTGQEELVHTGRLVPVYPTVSGLPQRTLRRIGEIGGLGHHQSSAFKGGRVILDHLHIH